jgi:L-aspartate oxidase
LARILSTAAAALHTDVLIIGGGIAGSYAALKASQMGLKVILALKTPLQGGSTSWAQGGMAIPLDITDSWAHKQDTLIAGRGLCDPEVVQIFVAEAPAHLQDLCTLGVPFAKEATREGGHSQPRVYHAYGDATGQALSQVLSQAVLLQPNIQICHAFACELLLSESGRVVGSCFWANGERFQIRAGGILMATGGAGQLYPYSSVPQECTGDGLAMAYRAGAELRDLEFIQFHPTVCHLQGKSYLITEAARGEGGLLRNRLGELFMKTYDPAAELAPRDVVARAVWQEHIRTGQVTLDLTHLGSEFIQKRFPNLYTRFLAHGIDISRDPIPVSPAAHFTIGGIKTDSWGKTTLPGLYAAGEVASTGLHGANRLASNSLSEGLVFGYRAIHSLAQALVFEDPWIQTHAETLSQEAFERLQMIMLTHCGLERQAQDLEQGLEHLPPPQKASPNATPADMERGNLALLAQLVLQSAFMRQESRGSHYRVDFPESVDPPYHSIQQQGNPLRRQTQ